MLSFECIKNEKSVYFLLTSAQHARCNEGGCPKFSSRGANWMKLWAANAA